MLLVLFVCLEVLFIEVRLKSILVLDGLMDEFGKGVDIWKINLLGDF